MVSLVSELFNKNNTLRLIPREPRENLGSLFYLRRRIMKYALARIQVLKNRIPETAMVYIIGNKEIPIPLELLVEHGYEISCSFEQGGSTYLILADDN